MSPDRMGDFTFVALLSVVLDFNPFPVINHRCEFNNLQCGL